MTRLTDMRDRLDATSKRPWTKIWATRGSGPTTYNIVPSLPEADAEFILCAREDMRPLLSVVQAVLDHRDARKTEGDIIRQIAEMRECNIPYWDRIADKLEPLA